MAYITVAQMRDAISARLGQLQKADNPAHWADLAVEVRDSAYNAILSEFARRRFSTSQVTDLIAGWDRGAEFNKRIGFCHFLRESVAASDDSIAAIEFQCKCEEELMTVVMTIDGVILEPSPGRIGYGPYLDDDEVDRHTIDTELEGL